jgi:hypothetical protein
MFVVFPFTKFRVISSSGSLVVAMKPRAIDKITSTAMLLFYILKKVSKMCLLHKGILLCMYIRFSKWRVWHLTHTFARSPFYFWIVACRKRTRYTVYIQRHIKAISCNYCCSARAMSSTYSDCVFVAYGTQREMRMRHCHLWRVRLCYIFPHYLINGTIFEKKKKRSRRVQCVFWFSLQLLCETFLILRRFERELIKIVYWPSCKVPVISVRF